MDNERFINEAIRLGSEAGLNALGHLQRKVFLISEAEASCDMDGIDSFIDRYDLSVLLEASEAFHDIGASAIATGLRDIAQSLPSTDDALLDQVNDLICKRSGYDCSSIVRYVAGHPQLS